MNFNDERDFNSAGCPCPDCWNLLEKLLRETAEAAASVFGDLLMFETQPQRRRRRPPGFRMMALRPGGRRGRRYGDTVKTRRRAAAVKFSYGRHGLPDISVRQRQCDTYIGIVCDKLVKQDNFDCVAES